MKNAPVQKANEGAPDSANSTIKHTAIELCRFIGVVPPDFVLLAALLWLLLWGAP
jgi:hypothetical protein